MMARVLIAEDEAFTAIALVETLERQGHLVRDAADGEAAIAALSEFHPDILVTDLMMPKIDGAALIRHVRASEGPALPVILVSGVPEAKLPEDIAYDAYLGKPIDHAELGRVVKMLARRG